MSLRRPVGRSRSRRWVGRIARPRTGVAVILAALAEGDDVLPALAQVEAAIYAAGPGPRLVFVNGAFVPSLSAIGPVPAGVR